MASTKGKTQIKIEPMNFSDEPKLYRMVVGAVGGQGGGAISEILFNAVRMERIKHGGKKGEHGSFEKRSMTPGLAQRSGSTITSLSFLDPTLKEDELPDNFIISEMPHQGSCDIVIAQEINELMKYIERVRPDGWVLANEVRSITPPEKLPGYVESTDIEKQIEGAKHYLKDGKYIGIDGAKIIRDNNLDPRSLNVIMMGMLSASKMIPISKESFLEAMKLRFTGKIYDINLKAFEVGEKYYNEGRYVDRDETSSWSDLSLDMIRNRGISTVLSHKRKRTHDKVKLEINAIYDEIVKSYPELLAKYVIEGFSQLYDFQNLKYANTYLSHINEIYEMNKKMKPNNDFRMTIEYARNMAGRILQWEGPFRVAEHAITEDNFSVENKSTLYHVEKKLQPTLEEITGMFPVPYFIYNNIPNRFRNWYDERKFKGPASTIKSTSFFGFTFFWLLAKMKKLRPYTVRYKRETKLIDKINTDIIDIYNKSPSVAEELCWYIGKIRGYSFVRHDHIFAYHKLVDGLHQILDSSLDKKENIATAFIKNIYANISNAGQGTEKIDEILQDHLNNQYIIPLAFPE